jgi:hypothetical protein
MSKEVVDRLIAEFGNELDLPDLALDEDGFVAIINDDGLVLNIDYYEEQETMVFYTTIGEIPDDRRLELYDEMLKANFAWQDTEGATLCVNPVGTHALLMASVTLDGLDPSVLMTIFNHLGELTVAWAHRLRAITGVDDETAETADAEPAPAMADPSRFA